MTRVYLIRHGESEWNAAGDLYCGRTDIGLSSIGRKQAEDAGIFLNSVRFDFAYASPLIRARDTAQIILGDAGLSIQTDERIYEGDFGEWEGRSKKEFIAQDPESWENWMANPWETRAGRTGETAREMYERASSFFKEIGEKHPEDTVLVVAHNNTIRFFLAGILGMPFSNYRKIFQDNTGINVLDVSNESILIRSLNINTHLR
ncbi:histidine phosphatase family protein [Pseudalkalibacillus hwajinpoensis]|uniref:Histidine phosphatase family protein n=1 Tax=Guptibacillus hwajinpoensis TaxID=208199 RepID=A0A4U1MB76_9BACL|nr:histidine phosphatase family protein [Pseudalkalibacillus hwajinpoensis]TKD68279.1 histidine phosphatase family protein [Pseudalkalibacillus hwajinpoensis]